jgi:hypothetical protein
MGLPQELNQPFAAVEAFLIAEELKEPGRFNIVGPPAGAFLTA